MRIEYDDCIILHENIFAVFLLGEGLALEVLGDIYPFNIKLFPS
jgi:hypothetical protein